MHQTNTQYFVATCIVLFEIITNLVRIQLFLDGACTSCMAVWTVLISALSFLLTLNQAAAEQLQTACVPQTFTNSLSLSVCPTQEFGQMEQTAQTSTPCAGHMTDPCWPLLMTLAKCTCSPSPALSQGSVAITHSYSLLAHQHQ